jgi:hypothetical protein
MTFGLMHLQLLIQKGDNNERIRSLGTLPDSQHFEDKGACWSSKSGKGLWFKLRRVASKLIIHTNLHKPNNKLVNA